MQNKNVKELANEIGSQVSDLGNYGPGDIEYKNILVAIGKEAQVIDTINKVSSGEEKFKFDKERSKAEFNIREKEFNFNKDKFESDIYMRNKQIEFEKEKFNFEKTLNEQKNANEQMSLKLKEKELEQKAKADKRSLIISIASVAVPSIIALVTNIISIKNYNRLAIRALNMEYIDNSITPRSYNECMNNINKFVSKK